MFVFFGLVTAAGTTYVQLLSAPPAAWAAGVFAGALASGVLVTNNLRDRAGDEVAGKHTLAVRLGDRRTRLLYVALVALGALGAGRGGRRHDVVGAAGPAGLPGADRAGPRRAGQGRAQGADPHAQGDRVGRAGGVQAGEPGRGGDRRMTARWIAGPMVWLTAAIAAAWVGWACTAC